MPQSIRIPSFFIIFKLQNLIKIYCCSTYCILMGLVLVLQLLVLELEQLVLAALEHTEWMDSLAHNLVVLHILLECLLVVGKLLVVVRQR